MYGDARDGKLEGRNFELEEIEMRGRQNGVTPGNADGCDKKGVAGRAICKVMKERDLQIDGCG
jgi:hypothetical protein